MKYVFPLALSIVIVGSTAMAQGPATDLEAVAENVTRQFMTKTNFDGEDLSGAKYFQVRLNEAKFGGSDIAGTRFEQCDLSNADFRNATLSEETIFNKVSMNDANLEGLDLKGAKLDMVNLRGANLKNTSNFGIIARTNFDGADLRGADLSDAPTPLDEVTFEGALYDSETKFPEGIDPAAAGAVKAS